MVHDVENCVTLLRVGMSIAENAFGLMEVLVPSLQTY